MRSENSMSTMTDTSTASLEARFAPECSLPAGWLARWPWVTFVLPMAVYMLVGALEPAPPALPDTSNEAAIAFQQQIEESFGSEGLLPKIEYQHYPYVYTLKIVLTLGAMVLVGPGYRIFAWRIGGMSLTIGVVGVVLWIALCHLRLEPKLAGPVDQYLGQFLGKLVPLAVAEGEPPSVGLMAILGTGERSAYNPLEQLRETPGWAYLFLAIRFIGLAMVVPVIEEFFLRGFLMRYVMQESWWQVPFGAVSRMALVVGTAIPMLMHPGELLAALVWFSMVTWLMVHTRSIWACVVAHAITNFLLGVYVVASGQWQLM